MRLIIPLALVALVLAGCTSAATPAPPTTTRTRTVVTGTVTETLPAPDPSTYNPPKPRAVRPLPPGRKPPAGQLEKLCPYIRSGVSQDPTNKPNVADIEGSHVYRTTVLTGLQPVGCRFFFYAPPYEAIADIEPHTFATTTAAYNAMVRTARAGHAVQGLPNFAPKAAPGVDGISYRTRFFARDGVRDWAFVFAKGRSMVVVHTEEKTTSRNAVDIARAIVGKF